MLKNYKCGDIHWRGYLQEGVIIQALIVGWIWVCLSILHGKCFMVDCFVRSLRNIDISLLVIFLRLLAFLFHRVDVTPCREKRLWNTHGELGLYWSINNVKHYWPPMRYSFPTMEYDALISQENVIMRTITKFLTIWIQ